MRETANIPGMISRMNISVMVALLIGMTFLVPGTGLANDPNGQSIDPRVWVEGDFIVSWDDDVDALHPAVATTPTNSITEGLRWAAGIHAVWDEKDDISGDWEIHYSMTFPDMPGYPLEWTGEYEDRIISEERKGKAAVMGDAVDPSIAVDSHGVIHVVWAQEYLDSGSYWEIHYARSDDNGRHWSSETGQVPGCDIPVSRFYGERRDAEAIPGGPKITVSYDTNLRAEEVLHVVWPEYTAKNGQEIMHSRSLNGGSDWSGVEVNTVISNTGSQEYAFNPSIGATGEFGEFIHVAWSQLMSGKAPSEEIFYTMSNDMGGSWQGEETVISDPARPGIIDSVDMATGRQDIHIAWAQRDPSGKATTTGVFYIGDFGGGWDVVEAPIDRFDNNIPQDVSVAVSRFAGKADPMEVHVVWAELDDNSPAGTYEIHTSYTPVPQEPNSWSGLERDNVISWPDDKTGIDAQNTSVALTYFEGKWEPRVVWDEANYSSTKDRAQQNNEIHFDPPAMEYTLTTSVVGSGSINKNPDQPTYIDGTVVTLTANPNAGWSFDHWSGDLSGSTNPDTIIMDNDKSVTAHFVHKDLDANTVGGPATCTEGDTIGISRSFTNIGTQDSGAFRYGLYLSTNSVISTGDTLVYSFQISNQAAGTTNSGTINVGLPMGLTGTFYYGLIVDYTYMVTESNEGNNWEASPTTVTISPKVFTLTLISSPVPGGSVDATPSGPYYYMDVVTLTAMANAGWSFDHWEGDLTGSTNPDTITMDGDKTVTAVFTQDQYTLTVSMVGSGSVVKDPDQATYTYGTPVQLTANPNIGWSFDHWSGDMSGSVNPDTITIYDNSFVTAHFTEDQYTLTTSVVGSGSIIKDPDQPTYTYGTVVQLTANPSPGWTFDHWSGDLSGSVNPDSLTIYGDSTVTAHFTQDQYTLTTSVVGSGSIIKDPDQPTYTYGTIVQLTANPLPGWSFDHWSGDMTGSTNPDTITIYGDSSVTAHFTEDHYTLTVNIVGGGSVIKDPNQATYLYGETVTLTANPSFGWEFDHWSGALTGSTNPDTITMYGDSTVWAHFDQIYFDIPLTAGWNLVSLPLMQSDTSILTVLSSISGQWDLVQYYDATDMGDHWKSYATFKPASLNDLSDLDRTMAFWLHTTSACTLTVYGGIPSFTNIPLYTGWNLVGYPAQGNTRTISSALAGTGYDAVEGFDPVGEYLLKTLADSYIMLRGEGYWVHVPADTTWTIIW